MVHGTIINTFWSRNSIRPAFNDFDSKSGSKYIVPAAPAPSKTCQFRRLRPWLRLCTPIEKDGPGSNDAVVLTQGLTFMKTEYRRGVVLVRCFFLVIYLLRFFYNNGLCPTHSSPAAGRAQNGPSEPESTPPLPGVAPTRCRLEAAEGGRAAHTYNKYCIVYKIGHRNSQ